MNRQLRQWIGYLFIPEESTRPEPRKTTVPFPMGVKPAGVSFKAVFWAGMAVMAALMLGRLS